MSLLNSYYLSRWTEGYDLVVSRDTLWVVLVEDQRKRTAKRIDEHGHDSIAWVRSKVSISEDVHDMGRV